MGLTQAFTTLAGQAAFIAAEEISRRVAHDAVLRVAPQGDGHAVLLDTGLLSGAHHVRALARTLEMKNFRPAIMPGRCNIAFGTDKVVQQRVDKIDELYEKYGPVTLCGESAGGLNLLLAAYQRPHKVRNIVLFGTPMDFTAPGLVLGSLRSLYKAINPTQNLEDMELARRVMEPLENVPRTSIAPTHDVIVDKQATIGIPGEKTENLSVFATHFGINSPLVQIMLLDRFAQKPETWKPFDEEHYHRLLVPAVYAHEPRTPKL